MKRLLLIGMLLASSLFNYAQRADSLKSTIQKNAEAMGHGGNNELKINLLFSVIGIPEISYERILQDNMGVGASVFVGLDRSIQYKFGFIPHFRIYFGAKKASGFFIEGNTSLITTDNFHYSYYDDFGSSYGSKNWDRTFFGLGAAAGAKFLTRNGFLGEAYLGASRLFNNKNSYSDNEAFPRMGITIGKRF